jgi:hypothetical protein
MILLFTTVALIGLILINVPIAVAIGIVALGGLLFMTWQLHFIRGPRPSR